MTNELPSRRFIELVRPERDALFSAALAGAATPAVAESLLQRAMRQAFRDYAEGGSVKGPSQNGAGCLMNNLVAARRQANEQNAAEGVAGAGSGAGLEAEGHAATAAPPAAPPVVTPAHADPGDLAAAAMHDNANAAVDTAAAAPAVAMPADAWARLVAAVQIEAAHLAGAGSDEALLAYDPDLIPKRTAAPQEDLPDGLNWSPLSRFILAVIIVLVIGIVITVVLSTQRQYKWSDDTHPAPALLPVKHSQKTQKHAIKP